VLEVTRPSSPTWRVPVLQAPEVADSSSTLLSAGDVITLQDRAMSVVRAYKWPQLGVNTVASEVHHLIPSSTREIEMCSGTQSSESQYTGTHASQNSRTFSCKADATQQLSCSL
jgi:hypothetical protein